MSKKEDPIHDYFELTYAAYLVIPRVLLQSLPYKWQEKFVELLEDARKMVADIEWNDNYKVQTLAFNDLDEPIIVEDRLRDYAKGRRKFLINALDKYICNDEKAITGDTEDE